MKKPLFKMLTEYNHILIAENEKHAASLFKMASDSRVKIVSINGMDRKKFKL